MENTELLTEENLEFCRRIIAYAFERVLRRNVSECALIEGGAPSADERRLASVPFFGRLKGCAVLALPETDIERVTGDILDGYRMREYWQNGALTVGQIYSEALNMLAGLFAAEAGRYWQDGFWFGAPCEPDGAELADGSRYAVSVVTEDGAAFRLYVYLN
jgi:hypothetical protein